VGKVVQPLQSVNYHDSHAHSHERHGPFTRLVRFRVCLVLVGFILVELVWFGVCNRWNPVGIVLVLATGVRPVSFGHFLAIGVRPVSLWLLVTKSNLGALSKSFYDTSTSAATGVARCGSFVGEGFGLLVINYR
jgi:hypothetical protein